jgi:tetratricopeptide (TPR) repeat protein
VLANLGRIDEAKPLIQRAVETDPNYAPALEAMGKFAAQGGDYAGALVYFDRAAEADPANADYAYTAAKLTLLLGRSEENITRLRTIAIQKPGHVAASNDLAWRLAELEMELDLALSLAKRASLKEPSADTLDTLGWVQYKQGSTEAAVATFKAALELRPESPSIRYRLGLALAKNGASEEARSELETALAAGSFPERDAAQAELARLQGS